MLLNRFNFIVWGTTPPEPADLTRLPVGGNVGRVSAVVVLIPGEALEFYFNPPTGLDLGASIYLDLVRDDAKLSLVQTSAGIMNRVVVPGLAAPQYYGAVVAPGGVVDAYYRLRCTLGQSVYYSNRLLYKFNPNGVDSMSARFSFRSARNLANVPYELPELAGFRHVIRLKCSAGNPQNDTTVEKYTGVTTGRVRTTTIQQNLYRAFSVDQADAIAHEGFTTMLNHKDLLVNGRPFSLKTGYQTGTDSIQLATGTFELWETEFALVTRC